jgi:hypothetical protein
LRYNLLKGATTSCGCQATQKQQQTNLERYGFVTPTQNAEVSQKVRQTNRERYGVEWSLQSETIKEKIKQTNVERYGAENPYQNTEIQQRAKQTNLERLGVENPFQHKEIQKKIRRTNLEHLGVEFPTQSESVREKVKQTNMERYGFENAVQNPEVREKAKRTTMEHFGVENSMQSPEVRDKAKKTIMELYGVEHVTQNPEIYKKIKKTNLERYGVEHVMQNPEIHKKIKRTNLERYGFENPMQNQDVKQKVKQTTMEHFGVENAMQHQDVMAKSWQTKKDNGSQKHSKGECEILEWVKRHHPDARSAHMGRYQIDVLIPSLNLAIEYNGLWWHCDSCQSPKDRNYHIEKQRTLKEKGIRTIFVWENEWQDRQEQTKNLLLAAMNISTVRLGARKCEFREIDPVEAQRFVNANHIQPLKRPPQYALGCFHEDALVAVTTFGLHHRNAAEVALKRFCCLPGYHVSGALSKFSKMAFAHFQQPLVSWADLMKSEGTGYLAAGWKVDKILKPDYFYINPRQKCKIITKQSRRKKAVHTPEGMTEAEHAKLDGLARCWDCGKIKFVFPDSSSS